MRQTGRPGFLKRLSIWLQRHIQVALASLGRLFHSPLSSLMTSAVIGIALALPTGLHVLLNNLQELSGGMDTGASISLFLKQEVDDKAADALAAKLRLHPRIGHVRLITRRQALQEFRQLSGFGAALEALQGNPLPAVLVIEPDKKAATAKTVQGLVNELALLPQTDRVQLDMQWVRRLQAITEIAQRAVAVLASLLGMAVLLIVGNTIRLEIQNRQAEIEISKLIGATNAFIRRPFLYTGLWFGLFGGVIAWLLVAVSILLLREPVAGLALLYQSRFDLSLLDATTAAILLAGSGGLGLAGSWLAVGRHLSRIEPV